MLMQQPTKEMQEQWQKIWLEYRDKLQPNRKTGDELLAYLHAAYPLLPCNDAEFLDCITENVTQNAHFREKLPAGTQPEPLGFWVERSGAGELLYAHPDPGFEDLERIFVGIDRVTGEFQVEISSRLWDELFLFRGLDARDLEIPFLVAQYVELLRRSGAAV